MKSAILVAFDVRIERGQQYAAARDKDPIVLIGVSNAQSPTADGVTTNLWMSRPRRRVPDPFRPS